MMRPIQLSGDELMCRLIEAWTGEDRPPNKTAQECLETMINHETRYVFWNMANIALAYFQEQLGTGYAIEVAPDAVRPPVQ